jgi:hypothetical protein
MSGDGNEWRLNVSKCTPHPRPLSLKGRGEKYKSSPPRWKDNGQQREPTATVHQFLLPSPLEGEGSGVRGS